MLPEELVQLQLDYYNSHDLEGFLSTYSEDIKIFNKGEIEPYISNIEGLRERYKDRLSTPGLKATISNRMVLGNHVIDYENVTTKLDDKVSKVIAVYEVYEDKIKNVTFIR